MSIADHATGLEEGGVVVLDVVTLVVFVGVVELEGTVELLVLEVVVVLEIVKL